jgi:hypothetical protein
MLHMLLTLGWPVDESHTDISNTFFTVTLNHCHLSSSNAFKPQFNFINLKLKMLLPAYFQLHEFYNLKTLPKHEQSTKFHITTACVKKNSIISFVTFGLCSIIDIILCK